MPKRDPDDLVADHSLRTLSITIGALLLAVTVVLMVNAVQRDREIERALHPTSTASASASGASSTSPETTAPSSSDPSLTESPKTLPKITGPRACPGRMIGLRSWAANPYTTCEFADVVLRAWAEQSREARAEAVTRPLALSVVSPLSGEVALVSCGGTKPISCVSTLNWVVELRRLTPGVVTPSGSTKAPRAPATRRTSSATDER